jgi:hypothetical protein
MTFDGNDWVYVGEPGFSSWNSVSAYHNILFDDSDILYVAYQEEIYNDGASVLTFNGEGWEYIGDAGFSAAGASFVSLVSGLGGSLFVAYRDNGNEGKCSVMSFDGSQWLAIGVQGFSEDAVSYTSVAIDPQNRLSVVFKDWSNDCHSTVMRFDDNNWSVLGEAGFSSDEANHQDIATNQLGHIYVAYEVGDIEVRRFVILGCIDPLACNFNPEATDDDGSCVTIETYEIIGELIPESGSTQAYSYTETAGSNYFWEVENGTILSGQGTANVEIQWGELGSGSLTVTETNAEDCIAPPVTIEITGPVGVGNQLENGIQIFPNPAKDWLMVELQEYSGDELLRIEDQNGKVVYGVELTGMSTRIDLPVLAPNYYFVSVTSHNGDNEVRRILIQD